MDPLKEMFNENYFRRMASGLGKVYKKFDEKKFISGSLDGLNELELNQRLRKTTELLRKFLPDNYQDAVNILRKAAPELPGGYTGLVLPDFVGMYGKKDIVFSLDALHFFTSFSSAEFAIRELLKTDLHRTLKEMKKWAGDKDPHVRRLASEGSRPRLPWSFKLAEIINDPSLTRPILEKLRSDDHIYVKKSVANHLNDISKDNTAYMIEMISGWDLTNENTRWIVKHASRSLIKKGHADSLALFSFEKHPKLSLTNFSLKPAIINLGDRIEISFTLTSQKKTSQKLVIDYAVHYAKSSGNSSRKVFKLKEINLLPLQKINIAKKQRFIDFSTRKHHAGKHIIEILVNGKKMAGRSFKLIV